MDDVIELQKQYWSPNESEKATLLSRKEELTWQERFRLFHLACSEMVCSEDGVKQIKEAELDEQDAPKSENTNLAMELLNELLSLESPFIPRPALVWQGSPMETQGKPPDLNGLFSNASMTHLGALETIKIDKNEQPIGVELIALDDLSDIIVASKSLFSYAKLFFDNGRPEEIVLLPLLYGYSWNSTIPFDTDGTMTRFICRVKIKNSARDLSIGIGHQDFFVQGDGVSLLGLGSIGSISLPLYVKDPKFEQKCRARGLDPEAIREQMRGK